MEWDDSGDEMILLSLVTRTCKEKPHMLPKIISAATYGIEQKAIEANKRAVDMEVLASVMFGMMKDSRISPKTKEWFAKLAESKLSAWFDKGELRCTWEGLENKEETK